MNAMSIVKRVVAVGITTCCMAALSPLATANASSYAGYSTVITANPTAAAVSQGDLLVQTCSRRNRPGCSRRTRPGCVRRSSGCGADCHRSDASRP